nr:hypothetical protein [Tanacetum cinerariifolium]
MFEMKLLERMTRKHKVFWKCKAKTKVQSTSTLLLLWGAASCAIYRTWGAGFTGGEWWKVVGVVGSGENGKKMWKKRVAGVGEKHCTVYSVLKTWVTGEYYLEFILLVLVVNRDFQCQSLLLCFDSQLLIEHFNPVGDNTCVLESVVLDDSACLMLLEDAKSNAFSKGYFASACSTILRRISACS